MAHILRNVFPDGLMPSNFVNCCINNDKGELKLFTILLFVYELRLEYRMDLLPGLVPNLPAANRAVLGRLILMLVNLKEKRFEMEFVYKQFAECVGPAPKPKVVERSRSRVITGNEVTIISNGVGMGNRSPSNGHISVHMNGSSGLPPPSIEPRENFDSGDPAEYVASCITLLGELVEVFAQCFLVRSHISSFFVIHL